MFTRVFHILPGPLQDVRNFPLLFEEPVSPHLQHEIISSPALWHCLTNKNQHHCDPCMSMWEPCATVFDFVNSACETGPWFWLWFFGHSSYHKKKSLWPKSTFLIGCELLGSSLLYRMLLLKRKLLEHLQCCVSTLHLIAFTHHRDGYRTALVWKL